MKKFKYTFLIIATIVSLALTILSFYMAFFSSVHSEILLIQYFGAYTTMSETSITIIRNSISQYTISFTVVFVVMLIIFVLSTVYLALSLKKEISYQDWKSIRKRAKANHAAARKAKRIAELEQELKTLKKEDD